MSRAYMSAARTKLNMDIIAICAKAVQNRPRQRPKNSRETTPPGGVAAKGRHTGDTAPGAVSARFMVCHIYTSDAADEKRGVALGGRRIIII